MTAHYAPGWGDVKQKGGLVLKAEQTRGGLAQPFAPAQQVNNKIGKETGLGSSVVHYLFWNIFRNCCPRDSGQTHCSKCGDRCRLPSQYKKIPTYNDRCVFSGVCLSANREAKLIEPPYMGHFY